MGKFIVLIIAQKRPPTLIQVNLGRFAKNKKTPPEGEVEVRACAHRPCVMDGRLHAPAVFEFRVLVLGHFRADLLA